MRTTIINGVICQKPIASCGGKIKTIEDLRSKEKALTQAATNQMENMNALIKRVDDAREKIDRAVSEGQTSANDPLRYEMEKIKTISNKHFGLIILGLCAVGACILLLQKYRI